MRVAAVFADFQRTVVGNRTVPFGIDDKAVFAVQVNFTAVGNIVSVTGDNNFGTSGANRDIAVILEIAFIGVRCAEQSIIFGVNDDITVIDGRTVIRCRENGTVAAV